MSLLVLGVVWFGARVGDPGWRLADNWGTPVFVTLVVLFLAVLADTARLQARPSEWDGVVITPAYKFERATSIFFAGEGWEAQRDDPDYKLFIRRNQNLDVGTLGCLFIIGIIPGLIYMLAGGRSGQTVVTLEIYPVMEGTRVRMTQSRGDRSADRFMRELPGIEVRPEDKLRTFGDSHSGTDAPGEFLVLPDEEAMERRFDPRYDQEERAFRSGSRIGPREDRRFDPYRDTRARAGYPSEEAFRRDWPEREQSDNMKPDFEGDANVDIAGRDRRYTAADRARLRANGCRRRRPTRPDDRVR
jgi:hypothetical protein